MAESLVKLKKRAKKAGMDAATARSATREQLESFLSNGTSTKKKNKKAVKKATSKKTNSKPASSKKKSSKPKASSNGSGDAGRLAVGKIDYTVEHDDWKPRKGSPVDIIFRALKKRRDNIEKVYDDLKGRYKEFSTPTKPDGTKRTKAEMLANLRYRINRTRFEFAVRTGQHEAATNRVKYGTGAYAKENKKARAAEKRASKPKASGSKSTK
jgi:hypothetical protein